MLSRTPAARGRAHTEQCSGRGFTLIEIAITLVVLGILIFFAVPAFQTWTGNQQVRNVAESIQNGLRLAQAEATKRNAQVDFVLTGDDLVANPTNASPTASATGTSWVVRLNNPATFIQGKSAKEGNPNATIAVLSSPAGFDGTIGFTGLGRTTLGGALALEARNPASDRPLQVLVSTGGKVRMCDDSRPAGDPQACT